MVALFFAVEKSYAEDAAIYVLDNNNNWLKGADLNTGDPFSIKEPKIFLPKHVTTRLRSQQGVFTIQPDVFCEFSLPGLKKIIINKDCVEDIKWKLFTYGFFTKTIFPDIDGLCSQIKWSHFDGF